MKINYTFKHQQVIRNQGRAEEDFYIAPPEITTAGSGLLQLEMFIDSYWHNFSNDRESSGSTAFLGLISSGSQLRENILLKTDDVVLERQRNSPLHSVAMPGNVLHRKVMIITCNAAFDALSRVLFPANPTIIRNGGTPAVKQLFDEMQQLLQTANCHAREISVILFKLLQELSNITYSESYSPQLLKALQYIRIRGCQHISRRELASAAGISERSLNTLFQQYLHTSPTQYLIARKIKLAQELLSGGKFSVTDTARMCGFSTPEFFIRSFRTHTGCTPGQWQTQKITADN